jgi:release factor glutamine methyltransferase
MSEVVGTQSSWTVGGLLNWTAKYLAQKGAEFPRLDAEVLLAHALECKRIDLYGLRFGEPASEEVRQRYRDLVRRRVEGCPVAYLVGRKEFFSLEFEVSPAVLIPRPDTELVVTACLDVARAMPEPRVLDLGTGSGCLAVTVAKQHPGARVTAVDIDAEALAMARRNAERHGVAQRIQFLQGDLFEPLPPDVQFDLILSNPPYIPRGAIASLPPGVRDYEPHVALDGGPSGYAVLERIAAGAKSYLAPGGYLIVEIGSPQEMPARERVGAHLEYELEGTLFDSSGHPRVLRARRKP